MFIPDSPTIGAVDFDRYRTLLIRHLRSRFGGVPHDDISDAVADAFVLYLHSAPCDVRSCRKRTLCWLRAVARRRLWKMLKNRGRAASCPQERKTFGGRVHPIVDSGTAEYRAARWTVESLLSRLHPDTAQTVLLYAVEEYRPREIAALLGCPVTTVKSRVKRGLQTLRNMLKEP